MRPFSTPLHLRGQKTSLKYGACARPGCIRQREVPRIPGRTACFTRRLLLLFLEMEALRAAGRAVLRCPSLARHHLGVARLRRHRQELPECWPDIYEPLLGGMSFALKYLGMTLVEKPKGEDMASAAIHRIIAMVQMGPKKFPKVILTVSPQGLSLQDAETKETIETISIYRISYCTTDKLQNKVFAYVALNRQSGILECHAFLTPKKKIAQAVTLTVAQAFQVALDLWQAAQAGSREEGKHLLSPLCLIDCQPIRTPLGNPSFKTDFEDEDDEEGDLYETFSGCREPYFWELACHTVSFSSCWGMQSFQHLSASRDTSLKFLNCHQFVSRTTLLSALHTLLGSFLLSNPRSPFSCLQVHLF